MAIDQTVPGVIPVDPTVLRPVARQMDDEHMESFFELLDDLMAYDGELENPVNQTAISQATLDQTDFYYSGAAIRPQATVTCRV